VFLFFRIFSTLFPFMKTRGFILLRLFSYCAGVIKAIIPPESSTGKIQTPKPSNASLVLVETLSRDLCAYFFIPS
jgi:hypothetical protein